MFSTVLKILFIVILLASIAPAQTADVNLNRLSEAVQAINDEQLPRAEQLLNSVLTAVPGDADALNLLGVVRAKQQRPAEAETLFRRALLRSPSHVGAHINLGELLITTNRSTEALPILLRAHKLAPSRPDITLKLGMLYADKRDYQQAQEYLSVVPRESFTDDYFLATLRTLIGLKRNSDVHNLVSQFRAAGVQKQETRFEFVMLLVRAGFNDAAHQILEEALASKPDDVPTLRALARVERATGNLERALSHLVEAKRIAPNSPAVLYDFGVTTLQMDLVLDALPVFEQLHRDYPREPIYFYGLAAAHWRKGNTADSIRLLNQYVTLQPRDASGWYLLGAALLRQERTSEAQATLQRSLSLKADTDTEYLLAVSFDKLGNRAAAIKIFRKIVASRPDHAAAHAALGTAYREAGSYAEARVELERAVELDANDLRANYQLGLVYAKLGEKEAARKMFDRADELRKRQHDQERVILKLIDAP
jgi:tetratricopeptide (TPR) repeat protein